MFYANSRWRYAPFHKSLVIVSALPLIRPAQALRRTRVEISLEGSAWGMTVQGDEDSGDDGGWGWIDVKLRQ
jgi:hypothetical protein